MNTWWVCVDTWWWEGLNSSQSLGEFRWGCCGCLLVSRIADWSRRGMTPEGWQYGTVGVSGGRHCTLRSIASPRSRTETAWAYAYPLYTHWLESPVHLGQLSTKDRWLWIRLPLQALHWLRYFKALVWVGDISAFWGIFIHKTVCFRQESQTRSKSTRLLFFLTGCWNLHYCIIIFFNTPAGFLRIQRGTVSFFTNEIQRRSHPLFSVFWTVNLHYACRKKSGVTPDRPASARILTAGSPRRMTELRRRPLLGPCYWIVVREHHYWSCNRAKAMVHCAGCERPILDRFLLNVLDRAWHVKCVQCCECKCNLTDKCFSREGRLYCKNDFFR